MVQRACECLEKAPDKETTLRLIDTLRTVTEGKVRVPRRLGPCLGVDGEQTRRGIGGQPVSSVIRS